MNFLTIPNECPICGATLIREKKNKSEMLICPNSNCGCKLEGRLLNLFGTNGLDIESISVKTVNKLIELGWLTKMSDVFNLKSHRDEWITIDGFGENSVDKILEAIPTSIELWRAIAISGIAGIEKATAKVIAKEFKDWTDFRNAIDTNYDFTKISGIGTVTTNSILEFDYTEIDDVMCYLTIKEEVVGGKLDNQSFCITGKLSMKRDDLVKIIEQNGGKFASVNKNLTYLICNDKDSNSGKSKKAKDLGVTVITEDEFMDLIK